MAYSVDPDKMPLSAASDLFLHCLQRPILGHYSKYAYEIHVHHTKLPELPGPHQVKKVPAGMRKMCRFRSSWAWAMILLVENALSDCENVQADLALSCPHMPEDTFLHGWAQLSSSMCRSFVYHTKCYKVLKTWFLGFYNTINLYFFCLFVNPMGSCRARSVYLTTRLLGRLSPLSG